MLLNFILTPHTKFPIIKYHLTVLYIMLQLFSLAGIKDSSGLSFTYINTSREHDAGILYLGHTVNNLMIIPPKAANFTVTGLCTDSCTKLV